MSQGNFLKKSDEDAWNFLEELSEKIIQQETFTEKPTTEKHKNIIHSIENSIAAEAKIATLTRRMDAFEIKEPSTIHAQQVQSLICNNCQASNHILEDCPLLAHLFANNQEQLNVVFQRQTNNPYGPTYNPG